MNLPKRSHFSPPAAVREKAPELFVYYYQRRKIMIELFSKSPQRLLSSQPSIFIFRSDSPAELSKS